MRTIDSKEFGSIQVRDIPMPEGVNPGFTTYTPSGRVSVQYHVPGEADNYYHIISMNDDGSNVHEIFAGDMTPIYRSNGYRYMPFNDNKRAYIGDWILECEPDCDHAVSARLIPIHYPDELVNTPGLWMVWSENVVSPDGKTIAWSALGATGTVYAAELRREKDCYELDHVRNIGTTLAYEPDPQREGYVLQGVVRGGEVKEFVRGGLGLSFVGIGRGPGNSMYQALDSEETCTLTLSPGYDETCMISPDEKLGAVMSSRFSSKTNCAILGLLPRRGNEETKSCLTMNAYLYAVADVRSFREGSIGPALVHMDRSKRELDYQGVDLSDPEKRFVFCSPMSWHPEGKKVMWNECLRKSLGNQNRVMIAELLDYVPGPKPPIVPVPQDIPYAKEGILKQAPSKQYPVMIAGLHSGRVTTTVEMKEGQPTFTTVYENFSDDGETFLSGYETANNPGLTSGKDVHYKADLTMTGAHTGRMEVTLGMQRKSLAGGVSLSEDSCGYATYDDVTIDVKDMR
ncbi:MAG: hypothetical protein J6P72_10820 [Firmicutes bacterium]|nr:hypothetical protein [Bacillota bacterium]